MTLYSLRDLSFAYAAGSPWEVPALREVSIEIEAGERVAIIGPPLAGKSTLALALAGLLPVGREQVWFQGEDMAGPEFDRIGLRQVVGMLFQESRSQVIEDVVGKDVAFGPTALGLPARETRARVEESLNAVGLPYEQFRLRYVHTLSGGQVRRVALAGVLAMRPSVLILDEPTAGLDPGGREEVEAVLRRVLRERAITLVVCSTGLTGTALLCERAVLLDGGRALLEGPIRSVLHEMEGMGDLDVTLPDAALLAQDLRSVFPDLPADFLTLDELTEALLERMGT